MRARHVPACAGARSTDAPVLCSFDLVTFARPPAALQELIATGGDLTSPAKQYGKDRVERRVPQVAVC